MVTSQESLVLTEETKGQYNQCSRRIKQLGLGKDKRWHNIVIKNEGSGGRLPGLTSGTPPIYQLWDKLFNLSKLHFAQLSNMIIAILIIISQIQIQNNIIYENA